MVNCVKHRSKKYISQITAALTAKGFVILLFPAKVRIYKVKSGIHSDEKKDSKKTAAFESGINPGPPKASESCEARSEET